MFKELSTEMKKFIKDMEDNIKSEKDLKYVLKRSEVLFDIVLKEINTFVDQEAKKLKEIRTNQKRNEKRIDEIENKIGYIDESIDNLCKDIYEEEEEFRIICPYCNFEFIAEIFEDEPEIRCPECNNPIELDWNGDSEL